MKVRNREDRVRKRRKRTNVGELAVLPDQEIVLLRESLKLLDQVTVKVLHDVDVSLSRGGRGLISSSCVFNRSETGGDGP